jgi:hypothetical protein
VLNWKGRNRKRKGRERTGGGRERERAERDMVSNISFIQANLQHSIAASRILTRTVSVKGIDMTIR